MCTLDFYKCDFELSGSTVCCGSSASTSHGSRAERKPENRGENISTQETIYLLCYPSILSAI